VIGISSSYPLTVVSLTAIVDMGLQSAIITELQPHLNRHPAKKETAGEKIFGKKMSEILGIRKGTTRIASLCILRSSDSIQSALVASFGGIRALSFMSGLTDCRRH
jgi:hypothetical protein